MSSVIEATPGTLIRGQQKVELATSLVVFKNCKVVMHSEKWSSLFKEYFQVLLILTHFNLLKECELHPEGFLNNSVKIFAPVTFVYSYASKDKFYDVGANTFSIDFTLRKSAVSNQPSMLISQFFIAINLKPIVSIGQLITLIVVVLLGVLEWNTISVEIVRKTKWIATKIKEVVAQRSRRKSEMSLADLNEDHPFLEDEN